MHDSIAGTKTDAEDAIKQRFYFTLNTGLVQRRRKLMVRTDDPPRLSEKFTFAISEATKQRIKKLPRGVQLGAHLRAALDKILDKILDELE
ncbi:MAG: hypothetical protein V1854_04985 [Methanobacteriota archaeon]